MDQALIEHIAGLSPSERSRLWNQRRSKHARDVAEAKRQAAQLLEARLLIAGQQLRAACGPGLAALEFQRDEAIAEFVRQQEEQLARFREQWDAHIAQVYGEPRRAYDAECAAAQAEHDAAVEDAQGQLAAFEKAFNEGKQLARDRAKAERAAATPAGQRALAEDARAARQEADELAFAIQTGWPPMFYMRWQHEQHLAMGGSDEGAVYHRLAGLREQYLAHYPDQRAMVESPTRDLYDAWLAANDATEADRPYMAVRA